jgi:hypothetical protein
MIQVDKVFTLRFIDIKHKELTKTQLNVAQIMKIYNYIFVKI